MSSIDRYRSELAAAFHGELDLDKSRDIVKNVVARIQMMGLGTPFHVVMDCVNVAEIGIDVLGQNEEEPNGPIELAARVRDRFEIVERDGVDPMAAGIAELRVLMLYVQALLRTHAFAPALDELRIVIDYLENLGGVEIGRGLDNSFDPDKLAAALRDPGGYAQAYRRAIALALFASFGQTVLASDESPWPPRPPSPASHEPLHERAAIAVETSPAVPDDDRRGDYGLAFMRAFSMATFARTPHERRAALHALDDEALRRPSDAHGELSGAVARAYRARLEGDADEAAERLAELWRRLTSAKCAGYKRDMGLCVPVASRRSGR